MTQERIARTKPRDQWDLRPNAWERLLAPSLGFWTTLAGRVEVSQIDWTRMREGFEHKFPSSEQRTRMAIAVLAIMTLALVGLCVIIGQTFVLMGRVVSANPTSAPRWLEIGVVAIVAAVFAWNVKRTAELRRRLDWQRRLLRQIDENVQLLVAKQDADDE